MGTVLGMPISGLLCQWFGWEYVFYYFGKSHVICCHWFVITLHSTHCYYVPALNNSPLWTPVWLKFYCTTIVYWYVSTELFQKTARHAWERKRGLVAYPPAGPGAGSLVRTLDPALSPEVFWWCMCLSGSAAYVHCIHFVMSVHSVF